MKEQIKQLILKRTRRLIEEAELINASAPQTALELAARDLLLAQINEETDFIQMLTFIVGGVHQPAMATT